MMRTKLFRSFLIVILAALLASFLFQWLIIKDFDNYVTGVKEDELRWIQASLENSYRNGQWDKQALSGTIHWAMMLGLDMKVLNTQGQEIMTSEMAMESLPEPMKQQMAELFQLTPMGGKYDQRFLYLLNQKIGTLLFRPLPKKELKEKEIIFKKRARNFLLVSLLIAGLGALLLALIFSRYLSRPLTDLKKAAQKVAEGDFNIRIPLGLNKKPENILGGKGKRNEPDEIARLSETFNFMASSLQKEEELRKHLFSNIHHELRTPLTIMKAHVEAMMDGVMTDQEAGLEVINNETEKLIRLVKGIEDITIAEANFFKQTLKIEINLKEFLSGVVDGMGPVAKEKGLFIKMDRADDLNVFTDVDKLEIILQNILSNALKFTERGGIEIDYGNEGQTFFIKFQDTGRGIPEEKIAFIFDRFYQAEPSDPLGSGLGLAIVKELVTALGGTIEVESEVGQGTTFKIILPAE
jgi:two-component system, OmpR family, sensor histidine kinase BaeS